MDKNAASRTSCLALTWLRVLIHVAIWNSSASGSVPTQQPVRALQETPPAACSCGPLDAHWQQLREATWKAFTPDFAKRVLNYSDPVFFWIRNFPCPDLPATSPRGAAALSDCAPGVILLHVLCAQRKLLQLRFDEAQEQLVEALMALPFAEECLRPEAVPRWPTSAFDVQTNYVRFYRAVSYYIQSAELLDDLLWQPTRTCVGDEGCSEIPGHVCNKRLNRCIPIKDGCSADAEVCPPGGWCTSITSPGEDRCSLELSPICISHGELQAFHPGIDCLQRVDYPGMIKACSEMGTTLYPLNWSSSPSEHLLAGAQGREAMILPVTLRLRSPWHMLHSLVPAYAQSKTDGRYGLLQLEGDFDLLIVDQDLDKDRHIWEKVLGDGVSDTTMGGLDFLLRLISDQPYKLLKEVTGSCYRRVVWGHELMLYSGGGWTNEAHMSHFVLAARDFVQSEKLEDSVRESRLLLVERRNSSAWGRWIDNFDSVREAAHEWVSSHPDLVSSLEVADLAELSWPDQLRLAARTRLMFGAHGDGLSWSVFMGEGSALVEAVPARDAGFQACVEGQDKNPYGIFGGIARLARVLHFCFLTNASETQAAATRSEEDLFQWGWRQLNLHINIDKLREYLSVAAAAVANSSKKSVTVQRGLSSARAC